MSRTARICQAPQHVKWVGGNRREIFFVNMTVGPATPPPYHDVALAKLYLGQAARQAAETIIQLHGGMGMTEELPVTRLNKRLLMAEFDYGGSAWHMRQLLQAA